MDDSTHLRGLELGDPAAFAEVYRLHKAAVYRYACALCGRSSEAEDLLQEAFLGLLRNLDRVDERSPLLPYLLRSVRHRHIDRLRSFAERGCPLPEGALVDPQPGLEEQLTREERIQAVTAAIGELPESQGEIVRLRVYAGLEYEGIADMLALPRDTVRSRYRAAIDRLRERLRRSVGDA
ncbi:MAG: RNA polymerase sigma factor [Planctomycetota bacterium]